MATNALLGSGAIVLDCPDPAALAGFYATVLGWPAATITHGGAWATLVNPAGGLRIEFQRAADYRPPTWPDPTRPQMCHFDLEVSDLSAAAREVLAAGATALDLSADHPTFQVYADPAGHPFCLCAC